MDRYAAAALDRACRRRELDGEPLGQRRDERADARLAKGGAPALGGFGEIQCRELREVGGVIVRPKHEFDGRAPVTEIARHRLRTGDVRSARGVVDRARGADLGGEKVLELARAGITSADPHFLTERSGVNVAAPRRGFDQRI